MTQLVDKFCSSFLGILKIVFLANSGPWLRNQSLDKNFGSDEVSLKNVYMGHIGTLRTEVCCS